MKITATVLAVGMMLGLSACGEAPKAPAPSETAGVAPEAPPGVTLSDARVQLPAVSGRPGVAYFTISQASGPPRAIAAVSVEMAGRTELHETAKVGEAMTMRPVTSVPLESGTSVEFAPGGKHVMLFDLDPKMRFADSVELTVSFDSGDKASAPAKVTTVNAMEGMN